MQKKLIALAIAGLASSAAFAQSNVTVYGVADVYVGTANATGAASKTVVNSSGLAGSRIGFKGVEDLGNGLKALFTLEYALAVDADQGAITATSTSSGGITTTTTGTNGSGIGAARQSFVGLTGGFGTAVAGRLQTAGYDFSGATNALHGTAINALDRVNPTALINSSSRANNAVAYISPSFGGVTIAVNHARLTEGATGTNTSDAVANLVSATYANGPLTLAGVATAIATNAPSSAAAGAVNSRKEWAIGGAYDFGVLTLKASYLTTKVESSAAVNTENKSDKAWQISGIVPVSSVGKIVLGYAKTTVNSTDTAAGAVSNDGAKSYTVAYLHSLSKRTTAYAGYQNVKNDNGTAGYSTALATTTTLGGVSRAIVAGVNHSF